MPITGLQLITVTGKYLKLDGTAAAGSVSFTPSQVITNTAANEIVYPVPFTAPLGPSGTISIQIPATDDPDLSPAFQYIVTENITGLNGRTYIIVLPYNLAGATIDLADIAPVPADESQLGFVLLSVFTSSLAGAIDGNARVAVRKNSTGSAPARRRLNLIEGSGITITVADDAGNEEVDITFVATGAGGGAPSSASYVTLAADATLTAEAVLGTAVIMYGTFASRPAASTAGRLYYASDTFVLYRDSGAGWVEIAASDWTALTGKPTTFAPSAHSSSHNSAGGDPLLGTLDANARIAIRKGTGAVIGPRRRLSLIEGAGVSITVADDAVNEEVDITFAATGAPVGAQYLVMVADATLTSDWVLGSDVVMSGLSTGFPAPGAPGRIYAATDTGGLYRDTGVAWSLIAVKDWTLITGKPSTFPPTGHAASHATGGSDALTGNADAVARTTVRKNSGANVGSRRRLNLIEGANVTITAVDDAASEEVDITIAAAGTGAADANVSGGTILTGVHWGPEADFTLLRKIGYTFSVLNLNPSDSSNWSSRFANAKAAGIKLIAGCWPPPYTPTGDVWSISAGGVALLNFYQAHEDQILALFVFNEPLYINNITGISDPNGAHSAANLRGLRNAIQAVWPTAKIYHDLGWPSEWAPGGDYWAAYPGIGSKYADMTGVADYAGVYDYPFEPGGYQRSRALFRLEKESTYVKNEMGAQVAWLNQSHTVGPTMVYPSKPQIRDWNAASRNALPAGSIISMYVWEQDIYDDVLKNHPEQWSSTVGWDAGNGDEANLVTDYGVSLLASASVNAALINQALIDMSKIGGGVYLPGDAAGKFYSTNTIYLPSLPVRFRGDGPNASVLSAPTGYTSPLLTYTPTVGLPTYTRSLPRAASWDVEGIGFTKNDGWGAGSAGAWCWDFPVWNGAIANNRRLTLHARNCIIAEYYGGGINFLLNGCTDDSVLDRIRVFSNSGVGANLGSDLRVIAMIAMQNGLEGMYIDGRNTQALGCKTYSNGSLTPAGTRTSGLYLKGDAAGTQITNHASQDNFGPGCRIESAGKIQVTNLNCDRNCAGGAYSSGLEIIDSHDCVVTEYNATESYIGSRSGYQYHGLKVSGSGNYGNRVEMTQAPYPGATATLLEPVDPASNLSGTEVVVGASRGGVYGAGSGTSLNPDPYKAQSWRYGLTGNLTVNAPANKHDGCRLRLILVSDASSRTVTWNAVYKIPTIAASGASQTLVVDFQYDAATSKWICMSPSPVWF